MNKSELNNKLAKLYGIDGMYKHIYEVDMKEGIIYRDDLLINDFNRLMDLAVDNGICIYTYEDCVMCAKPYAMMPTKEFYENHESPQATTKYAIAMALVKLAEDK